MGYKIEKNDIGGACGTYGGKERRVQGFGGKAEGRRPVGRPRCRWEDNLKLNLQYAGCGGMDWIELAQDRDRWRVLVNTVMSHRVP